MPARACLALGFVLALTGLAQQSVRAEERLAWSVDSYESDFPEHGDTVILTYGVPETDAVAFQAVCGGPDGASARAVFWYDTIDLAEGQDVLLSFSVGDLSEEVPAKVYGKDAEVGVSGLEAPFSPEAPIWQAMANSDALTYGIPGGEQQELFLTGAAAALQKFTSACSAGASRRSDEAASARSATGGDSSTADLIHGDPMAQEAGSSIAAAIADMASAPPQGSVSLKAEAVSSDKFGTIKSARSQTAAEITFVNQADGYRGLMWIDAEGTPVDHAGIDQGETVVVPTYATHAWMITDGPGNCIEMVVAEEGDTTFEITAPGSVSSPEND